MNRNYEKRSTFLYDKHVFYSDTHVFKKDGIHRIKAVWINIWKMFDSFVFLPLSNRVYFKGRAHIKIILKNCARSYFAGGIIIGETRYV